MLYKCFVSTPYVMAQLQPLSDSYVPRAIVENAAVVDDELTEK